MRKREGERKSREMMSDPTHTTRSKHCSAGDLYRQKNVGQNWPEIAGDHTSMRMLAMRLGDLHQACMYSVVMSTLFDHK